MGHKKLLVISLLFSVLFSVMGCSGEVENPLSDMINQNKQNEVFSWSEKDFDKAIEKAQDKPVDQVSMTEAQMSVPYYKANKYGKPDDSYTILMYRDKDFGCNIDYLYDFGDFRNIFIHGREFTIAKAAKTINDDGGVIAEARLVSFTESEDRSITQRGFEVEETHCDRDGNIIFTCKSHFNDLGIKTGETERDGKKNRDYYFFWSVGF